LLRLSGFEHSGHPVGYHESAYDVARVRNDLDRSQNPRKHRPVRMVLTGKNDGAHNGDGIERVRQRHQGRMQQGRNTPYDFKSDKCGQHEDVKAGEQIQLHDLVTPFDSPGKAGSEKNSLIRGLTTSPSWVSMVSRTISSSVFSCSFPSFTRCSRKALTFRAYIWLA